VAGESKRPDSKGLAFFDITDFSPGIFDNSVIAFSGATPPGIFPAPPGAADVTATFNCLSEPNGGLGPGPALGGVPGSAGLSMTDIGLSPGGVDITALINTAMTPLDELVLFINSSSGTTQNLAGYSYAVDSASLNAIFAKSYTGSPNPLTIDWPFTTTMLNSEGGTQPEVVIVVGDPGGTVGNTYVYPPINSPTTFSTQEITDSDASSRGGTTFGHQGRIVVMLIATPPWPVTAAPTNENWLFTDPPEGNTLNTTVTVFGPEQPNGYGVVGSISAGEAFAVKQRGGAIIIQGDLNNPTVTNLPGVQSTGPIYGRPGTDQNGLYYCSDHQGAWLWNGGNASQKISTQLDDGFFTPASQISSWQAFYCQRWGDWMLFSNSWIYNTSNGSWWRLGDSTHSYFWYTPGYDPRFMFAALPQVTNDSEAWLFEYDRTLPTSSYEWQSLPIKLPSEDRTTSVRELVVRASWAYSQEGITQITPSLIDDKGNVSTGDTWTMSAGVDTVQETRFIFATKQTTTIAVNLACSGTQYAPVVHGLSIGHRPREHVAIT
jgi:hypothetical protein